MMCGCWLQAFFAGVIIAICVFHSSATEVPVVVEGGPIGYQGPLALPVVLPSGHLADTSEVAVARNRHISALVKAHATAAPYHEAYPVAYPVRTYYGPLANPVVLSTGHLADTSDVYAAKGAHYAALAHAASNAALRDGDDGAYRGPRYSGAYSAEVPSYSAAYSAEGPRYSGAYSAGAAPAYQPYQGPLAAPVVLENGFLADTHEVASAKGEHLNALAQAKATAAPPPAVVNPQ